MNWKTTISGAFGALGTFLAGGSIIAQMGNSVPQPWLQHLAIAGVTCQGLSIFFGHLFAADAKTLREVKDQTDTWRRQENDSK